MGMWGGGAGAGGWSSGIGGQMNGPRGNRGADNWDDDALGKVYDAQVVRRIMPYLAAYKPQAALAFACAWYGLRKFKAAATIIPPRA